MKKKIMPVPLLLVLLLTLTGCGPNKVTKNKTSSLPAPKMTAYSSHKEPGEYYYVVDERTGVIYIAYESANGMRRSMTVALNTDGTPITKDQLLTEKEK